MKKDIGILGSGAFGTALAITWSRMKREVFLWSRSQELAQEINATHINSKYWPNVSLTHNIHASDKLDEVCNASQCVVYACPSSEFGTILSKIKTSLLESDAYFVDTSKGLDPITFEFHHQIAERILGRDFVEQRYLCLSGPSFAAELVQGAPTCVTLASFNEAAAKFVQEMLGGPEFRALTTSDVLACELGGAMKNVLAIALGAAEGMNLGLNTQAALITRGLAEITRLGMSLGARAETFLGLSGLGDLVLTCTGSLSRNRNFGVHLGRGLGVEESKKLVNSTIEGIGATRAVYHLAQRQKVELPLCEQTYRIVFEGKSLQKAFEDILSRPLRNEWRID